MNKLVVLKQYRSRGEKGEMLSSEYQEQQQGTKGHSQSVDSPSDHSQSVDSPTDHGQSVDSPTDPIVCIKVEYHWVCMSAQNEDRK